MCSPNILEHDLNIDPHINDHLIDPKQWLSLRLRPLSMIAIILLYNIEQNLDAT